jgi:uncharacterized GH25 family protein
MTSFKKNIFTFILFILVSSNAFAHYIWIESPNESKVNKEVTIKIYYGEYNESVREIKGGKLEEVNGITFWTIAPNGKKQELSVSMQDKYYQIKFTPKTKGTYTLIATNTERNVMDLTRYNIGIVRPIYYASKQINIDGPSKIGKNLSYPQLIIVPYFSNDKLKPSFQVLFNNKALVNTTLTVHAPKEWSKEYKTDNKGVFTINPVCNGLYVIECIYKEEKHGSFKSEKFEAIRHRATNTFHVNLLLP